MFVGPTQNKIAVVARSFVIWGEELSTKGKYGVAEKVYQRTLALVERTLGGWHPMMAEVLEGYASFLAKTDRRDEGLAMKRRADAVWRAFAPPSSQISQNTSPFPAWPEREASD